jgi:hypothetical protein
LLVEFPMPARVAVRSVKNRLFEKRVIQLELPLGQPADYPRRIYLLASRQSIKPVPGEARCYSARGRNCILTAPDHTRGGYKPHQVREGLRVNARRRASTPGRARRNAGQICT